MSDTPRDGRKSARKRSGGRISESGESDGRMSEDDTPSPEYYAYYSTDDYDGYDAEEDASWRVFFATRLLPMLGEKDPTQDSNCLARWWENVRKHDAVARVDAEMAAAAAMVADRAAVELTTPQRAAWLCKPSRRRAARVRPTWVVVTPDFDLYPEEISENNEDLDAVRVGGVTRRLPRGIGGDRLHRHELRLLEQ